VAKKAAQQDAKAKSGKASRKKTAKRAAAKSGSKKRAPKKKAAKKKAASDEGSGLTAAGGKNGAGPQLSTGSRAKRRRAVEVILPRSTSRRIAEAARASVWAISSEKTTGMFEAAEDRALEEEYERRDNLAEFDALPPPEDLRRSARDPFAFFRAELLREERPDDPHRPWREARGRKRHELYPGLDPEELGGVESRLGCILPPSLWDFLLEWNGGNLFVREVGQTRVVSAPDYIDEVRGPLCNRMTRPYLPVVDLGCGDYLALDTSKASRSGENPLIWWYQGEPKKRVAESFASWLKRLVEHEGEPYWWH